MEATVVLYPYPGMGHIISMVELGKLMLHHYKNQFSVIILFGTSEFWRNPSLTSYITTVSQANPCITFHPLPPHSISTLPARSHVAMAFELIALNAQEAVQALEEISKRRKINFFVIDFFCTSALLGAKDLRIPTYYFFTSGAGCLAAFLYLQKACEKHTRSFKDVPETVVHFPDLPDVKAIHMPEPVLDRDDPAYESFLYFCSHLSKADGILINTFDDLEPKAVKLLADKPVPPTYRIGPLISGGSEAHHDCLSWLAKQPSKSVVFLCFGSRGSFSTKQVQEIAKGMEMSGHRFLWVVKTPPVDEESKQTDNTTSDFDLNAVLPEGFLERVQDRAMVVKSWAPQVAVLRHDSVGGFVTHCGWNSVLEAVVAGVPLVAWPLYAEQHLNRNLLVENMEMAIPVEQRDEDGFVGGDELERRVRELMDSERGKELREKSSKLKESAVGAWREVSGSSAVALAEFVRSWKKS